MADTGGDFRKGREQGTHFRDPYEGSHGPFPVGSLDDLVSMFGNKLRKLGVPAGTRHIEINGKDDIACFFHRLAELGVIVQILNSLGQFVVKRLNGPLFDESEGVEVLLQGPDGFQARAFLGFREKDVEGDDPRA